MKKNGNEKAKKMAVAAVLSAVGVVAAAGICMNLRREEPQYISENLAVPEETPEPVIPEIAYEMPEPSATPEIVVHTEAIPEESEDGPEQSIQQEPVKTEEEKPSAPPEAAEDTGNGRMDTPPENREIPAATPEPESGGSQPSGGDSPQHGAVDNGKIYIDGFGWIDYNGGETDVVQGGDIYENGNTIGIMD